MAMLFLAGMILAQAPGAKAEAKQKAAQQAKKVAEEKAKKEAEAKKAAEAKKVYDDVPTTPALKPVAVPKASLEPAAVAAAIDRHVEKGLAEKKLISSDTCTDAEFLRRASLDIAGVIPGLERTKAFLDSTEANKRAKLIDELLADANYSRKQADVWLAKLFPRDSANRYVQPTEFHTWLQKQFNDNVRWNTFVETVLTATGSVDEHPEVTFFLANRSIDKLTDATTQHFLGVRLGCAQCHNHPFTATKQVEYWGMAAFFGKVAAEKPKNPKKDGDNSKLTVDEGKGPSKSKEFFPESTMKVAAKFFEGPVAKLDEKEAYRPALATWLTSTQNPYFARAMVNRTWASLFGHGLIDPIDDMIAKNEPSHPELLDELAGQFIASGFDVKALIRSIALSKTYQRSSKPNDSNKSDSEFFSHQAVRQLGAEQLFDSLAVVLGSGAPAKGDAKRKDKKGMPGNQRAAFAQFYLAGAEEPSPLEFEAGIPQALRLMNSRTGPINGAAVQLTKGKKPDAAIESLYLTALSRMPSDAERKRLADYLKQAAIPAEAYGDILWAILNSSEFAMVK